MIVQSQCDTRHTRHAWLRSGKFYGGFKITTVLSLAVTSTMREVDQCMLHRPLIAGDLQNMDMRRVVIRITTRLNNNYL